MKYIVIVECENGLYRARIPSLPGLSAEGTTLEEALKEAQQEATSYLSRAQWLLSRLICQRPTSAVRRRGSTRREPSKGIKNRANTSPTSPPSGNSSAPLPHELLHS